MGWSEFRRKAAHAAVGVPRIYVAALKAGVGPSGAIDVLRISEAAMRNAAAHGRGEPGRTNAMRHFLWQALLTAHFGLQVAQRIAESQEVGTPDARDSKVDQHNNGVGQEHGSANADELKDLPLNDAIALLVPVALEKWAADELIWVKPR